MRRANNMNNMNRLGNAKNPYQDDSVKKVLTVCSAGLLRSPTAARILAEEYGYNTRAAGMVTEYALIPVDEVLIYWADEIVFMQQSHFAAFKVAFADNPTAKARIEDGKYQILNIPDNYGWMQPDLVKDIKELYDPFKVEV